MKNKFNLELLSDGEIIEGDWCYAYELGEIFQCKINNEPYDHYISTTGKIYNTNNDPHHVYKIKDFQKPKSKIMNEMIEYFMDIRHNHPKLVKLTMEMFIEEIKRKYPNDADLGKFIRNN